MSQPTSTHYRETVANFPSGVTVVTTRDGGEDFGLTVSAFTSLSLDPPMVLVSIDRKSKSHQHLVEGAPIGISVLAAGHTDVAVQFASPAMLMTVSRASTLCGAASRISPLSVMPPRGSSVTCATVTWGATTSLSPSPSANVAGTTVDDPCCIAAAGCTTGRTCWGSGNICS